MRVALLVDAKAPVENEPPRPSLLGTCGHLTVNRAIPLALSICDAEETATLVVSIREYRIEPAAATKEFDAVFTAAEEQLDRLIDEQLSEAAHYQSSGDLFAAKLAYSHADLLLSPEASPRRLEALLSLAELERSLARPDRAAELMDRLLVIAPQQVAALQARAAIAREQGEATLAAALLERVAPQLETSAKRVEVLHTIAEQSLKAARHAIGLASELTPSSIHLLERLRAVNEAAGLWEEAVSAAVQIAELTIDSRQRARALVDAARLCSERTHHSARAVALYEAAIQDDPEVAGAFDAIEAELLRAGDAAGLAAAYERQIERLRGAGAVQQQTELWRKLANLRRDALDDPPSAISALDQLIQLVPQDLAARIDLAGLLESVGEAALATRALELAATLEPTQVTVYRSLTRLFCRAGDEDRAYLGCSVLVALGEATPDEQLMFARYRPDGMPTPRSTLDEDAWSQLLPKEHSLALDELAIAIEPAALKSLARASRPSLPLPRDRVDLRSSSILAVRCFAYVAQLLGLPEPEIFLGGPETPVGVRVLPQPGLGIVLGRPALSDRGLPELVFLAAHHLTYARPGWRMIGLLSGLEEIRGVLLAGMAVARPDVAPPSAVGQREQELVRLFAECMDPIARNRVGVALEKVLAGSGTLDVLAWLHSVEETACRSGLLACGDVTVATNVLAIAGASASGLSAAERARNLYPFCVSQCHSALRHWLGMAAG